MPLHLDGDLVFTVDGPGGATQGTVVGDGRVLRVVADDPVAAWDAALGATTTGPAVLRLVADQLSEQGVVVEVSGPQGLVATVGAGIDSPLGRLLAGSRRVRLGRPAAVRPLAVAQVRRTTERLARPALLALGAATVLWALGRHPRR